MSIPAGVVLCFGLPAVLVVIVAVLWCREQRAYRAGEAAGRSRGYALGRRDERLVTRAEVGFPCGRN